MRSILLAVLPVCGVLALASARAAWAADQPQWGERYSRNLVSGETGLPTDFAAGERNPQTGGIDLPEGSKVRWVARLGGMTYGTPVVAGGRVLIGTNNETPRDERLTGDRGVLMCFDEPTGEYLWQLNLPKMTTVKWGDWRMIGITSTPSVEGDRAYLVSNRGEVMCLDTDGMADGNDGPFTDEGQLMAGEGNPPLEPNPRDADVIWRFDMAALKVEPHNASNCSPLVHGDLLYVCTSQGVEWTHKYVVNPEAPSVIVLQKQTGKLVARDDFGIGPDITHGQWSSLSTAKVGGRELGFFGAGDGVLYAFEMLPPDTRAGDEPLKLKNVFRFDGEPLAQTQDDVPPDHQHDSTSYQVTGNPVVVGDRIYVVFTQEPFHRMRKGWLVCLDATETGDVTRSALRWSYDAVGSSSSTVSVHDGLVYVPGFFGKLHCLDAETGEPCWVHEAGETICGSTLVADGKVYLGTARNTLWVLRAGREPEVLGEIRLRDGIYCTPTAANGTLFVATKRHLYAVGE